MFKTTKQLFSKSILPVVKTINMFSDQKNIKISQATHKRLKLFAAEHDISISDCADLLLGLTVTNTAINRATIDAAIKVKIKSGKT